MRNPAAVHAFCGGQFCEVTRPRSHLGKAAHPIPTVAPKRRVRRVSVEVGRFGSLVWRGFAGRTSQEAFEVGLDTTKSRTYSLATDSSHCVKKS